MSEREEWMTLIRNEYDPLPDLGKAAYPAFDSEWDDGAGRIADAILADKFLAVKAERERCANIARNGCLVPPDGGSPTEAESDMCEGIARRIDGRRQFYGAECPSYPACSGGCGLGCTKENEREPRTAAGSLD